MAAHERMLADALLRASKGEPISPDVVALAETVKLAAQRRDQAETHVRRLRSALEFFAQLHSQPACVNELVAAAEMVANPHDQLMREFFHLHRHAKAITNFVTFAVGSEEEVRADVR